MDAAASDESARQTPVNLVRGSPCLQGERVAFTGTLASMTHRYAHGLVERNGGTATSHVSKQTTMLVVGEEGWPLEEDGQPSVKWQQVERLRQEGHETRIVRESEWLHLLGLEQREQNIHRLYTPAMLSKTLDVPVHVIRSWERAGLIRAERRVFRLPYFDFQEVAGARRLSELLAAGIPRAEIEKSLGRLKTVLSGLDRPLVQLDILTRGTHVLCRDKVGLLEPASGQRLLDFESETAETGETESATAKPVLETVNEPADESETLRMQARPLQHKDKTSEGWYHQGCHLLEENEPAGAAQAFRLCLMETPSDPEVHFYLAEALYRNGNLAAALERYYSAVENDHDYIEAWTQLGCLHAELGQAEDALSAFDIALQLHSDYPDAVWHKAEVLSQTGRSDMALPLWRQYLQFDSRGPWAEIARQRLAEASDTDSATGSNT